jgi:hypothetical protein
MWHYPQGPARRANPSAFDKAQAAGPRIQGLPIVH